MIKLTERATKRITALIDEKGPPYDYVFRVAVNSGGCSGFSYAFSIDWHTNDDDLMFFHESILIVVDEASHQFIDGCEIDYVEDFLGASFKVSNPNAAAACGCGTSFGI